MLLKSRYVRLDEYKIRYNHDKSKHVGQGDGDSQVGDVVAKDGSQGKSGPGTRKTSGGSSRARLL